MAVINTVLSLIIWKIDREAIFPKVKRDINIKRLKKIYILRQR